MWTVEIVFTESGDRVRADALLQSTGVGGHGWGRATRSPGDPDIPLVGHELAAARALSDLAHQLLEGAADKVGAFEAHPVRLHL